MSPSKTTLCLQLSLTTTLLLIYYSHTSTIWRAKTSQRIIPLLINLSSHLKWPQFQPTLVATSSEVPIEPLTCPQHSSMSQRPRVWVSNRSIISYTEWSTSSKQPSISTMRTSSPSSKTRHGRILPWRGKSQTTLALLRTRCKRSLLCERRLVHERQCLIWDLAWLSREKLALDPQRV